MPLLRSGRRWIRESLFVLPLLVILLCGLLAAGAIAWDDARLGGDLPLLRVTVEGARSILTAVAGATITVAAIVFSITALSTQIAANQYTPRSVRGFFENGFQQVVIGFTIGTFTYALAVLAGLGSVVPDTAAPFPSLSVTVGIGMGVAAVIAIVAYIDHSLRRMQIDAVIRRIADGTLASIRHERRRSDSEKAETTGKPPAGEAAAVLADQSGWVQEIDTGRILASVPAGSTVRVDVRLGEAVSAGDRLLTLWGADPGPRLARRLRAAVPLGRNRSIAADPHFGLRQLVDIALRALSPGINDPTTAADVVHHMKIPLREILTTDPTSRVRTGPGNRRVFLPAAPSTSDLVHDAFAEIRLSGREQPSVIKAMLEVLADLIEELGEDELPGRAQALAEEARLTVAAIEGSSLPRSDVERTLVPARRIGEVLGDQAKASPTAPA